MKIVAMIKRPSVRVWRNLGGSRRGRRKAHARHWSMFVTAVMAGVVLAVGPLVVLAVGPLNVARGETTTVPDPIVTGPVPASPGVHDHPFLSAYGLLPLDANGFAEREYLVEGSATSAAGDLAPFKTRVLVRRPIDPADFNGTVVMDWFNVTGQNDIDSEWHFGYQEIMRGGYAYVGVSAQKAGVDGSPRALKFWDPIRYGSLSHPGDAYANSIFSQVAKAIKSPTTTSMLPGFKIERVLAAGQSQSGGRLNNYISTEQARAGLIDAFLVGVANGSDFPEVATPVIRLLSESEFGAGATPRVVASEHYRLWEVTGSAHVDTHYFATSNAVLEREFGPPQTAVDVATTQVVCQGKLAYSTFPRHYANKAALRALDNWVRKGVAPAVEAPATRTVSGAIAKDSFGNSVGGVRLPYVDVPTELYQGTGGCLLIFGHSEPLPADVLQQLYPTAATYGCAVREAAEAAVRRGHLLVEDATAVIAEAYQSSVGGGPGDFTCPTDRRGGRR